MKVSHHWGSHEKAGKADAGGKPLFKTQHEDVNGIWSDVCDEAGLLLTFASLDDARGAVAAAFPLETDLVQYGDHPRTRVVRVYRSDEEWREGST